MDKYLKTPAELQAEKEEQRRADTAMEKAASEKRLEEERLAAEAAEKQSEDDEEMATEGAETEAAAGATATAPGATVDYDGQTYNVPFANGAASVTPQTKTNEFINEVNSRDDKEEDEEEEEVHSPVRKKRKKKKDKKKKDKDKDKPAEPQSSIRKGKVGQLLEKKQLRLDEKVKTTLEKRKEEYENYPHNHERVIITAAITCGQVGTQAKMNEFILGGRALYKNLMKVDKTVVLEPEREDLDERLYEPTQLSLDLTEASAYMKPSGDAGVFEMRKPRNFDKKDKKKKGRRSEVDEDGEEAKVDPEVWTQICISCDEDPYELVSRVSFEWARIGGTRLQVKEIAAFATKSAATFYNVRSDANQDRLIEELKRFFEDTVEFGKEYVDDFYSRGVPEFALKLATPRIEGQNTQVFKNWTWKQQNLRKTLHIEVEATDVPYMHELIRIAKDEGIVRRYFGKSAAAAIVVEKAKKGSRKGSGEADMSKYDLAAVASWSKNHINYQSNTMYDGVRGILDLDRVFEIFSATEPDKVIARVTLRSIMYNRIKMEGDLPLFLEIHQGRPMMPVDVVVGNCEEAERMLLMINKNPAAYFYYYMRDNVKWDASFMEGLVGKVMDPTLVKDVPNCTWDATTKVLTTPQDVANEKLAAIEDAAWYKDEFATSDFDLKDKEKKEFSSKEQLEDLYEEKSYKTVTKKKGTKTTSGVEFGDVSKMGDQMDEEAADGEEEVDLSKLSKEQLIERLMKKAEITSNSGSRPSRNSSAAGVADSDDSGSSSSGSSGSSSTSSGVEDMSPSSAEGNTARPTPARSE